MPAVVAVPALRAVVVLVAALAALLCVPGAALAFSDVPNTSPFAAAVAALSGEGILGGFGDGSFRPEGSVTRQQFAKLLVGALDLPVATLDACAFPDVAATAGGELYPDHFVAVAAVDRLALGYTDGRFRPYLPVTRAQAVCMVVRALERLYPGTLAPVTAQEEMAGWAAEAEWARTTGEQRRAASSACGNGLLQGLDPAGVGWRPGEAMPRGEVAQLLYAVRRLLPPPGTYRSSVHALEGVLADDMVAGGSWRPGAPVALADLRLVCVTYWGFDGKEHPGRLVVHRDWAEQMAGVFARLYDARFPIRCMHLIDGYGGSDERSMAADNTSAYNCRNVAGTSAWSMHASGVAIDIDPIENPWVSGDRVDPAVGAPFKDRSLLAPGVIHAGDVVVRAFADVGWTWGGSWNSSKDYQHFSSNGR